MIELEEKKQIYGAPKITVGALTQGMTAVFFAVFVFSFFAPESSAANLALCSGELSGKWWTLLTGAVVFPESLMEFSRVPAGFWMICAFFYGFFFLRPVERALPNWRGWLFVAAFMLFSSAVLYLTASKETVYIDSWPFAFYAAAGGAAAFRRCCTVTCIPEPALYAAVPAIALIVDLVQGEFIRAALTLVCFVSGGAIIFLKKSK